MATDVVKKTQKKEKKEKKEKSSKKEKEENEESVIDSKKEKKKKKEKKRKAEEEDDKANKKQAVEKEYVPDGIQYLRAFHSDKNGWKFKKMSQVWCLQHMYDENVMNENDFKIMLEYMKDMKGQARTKTLREAQDKIPPEPTDVDNDVFDAEAALNAVPVTVTNSGTAEQEEHEDDTPMIKRARAVVRVLLI